MDKRQQASRWLFVAGFLIMLLGLIHVGAILVIFPVLAGQLSASDRPAFLYMFIATGVAVIFTGLLILYCSRGLKTGERWARTLARGAGLFMTLLGLGAVLAMPDNPFAYLSISLAIFELLLLWFYRKEPMDC